jgi:hypothetical protein
VTYFDMGFPKKEILMGYVSKSCDLLGGGMSKKEILMDDISNLLILKIPKNSKNVIKLSPKGNFDGLCKQVM